MKKSIINEMKTYPEINEILEHAEFKLMKLLTHHGSSSCYRHTLDVAALTFMKAKKKELDFISATRGALLHDFYLYDLKHERPERHVRNHPEVSLENAEKYFLLNDIERDIIRNHMWPLTPNRPVYAESKIVNRADKKYAVKEFSMFAAGLITLLGIKTRHAV